MDQEEFNSLSIEEYERWIFPNKGQNKPELTDEDIKCIYILIYY